MRIEAHVTHVYAEALFAIAKKKSLLPVLIDQAQALAGLLETSAPTTRFFEGPHISDEKKAAFIEKSLRPRFHAQLVEFALYLLRKSRIEYLVPALRRFDELAQAAQGTISASITTSRDLSLAEKLQLKAAFEKYTGKQLKLSYAVEPAIIGGVIFTAGDLHIDGSLRGQLERLEDSLLSTAVH